MLVNCQARRRLKAPRAAVPVGPGPTMGTPMVIPALDMAPPAPASRTVLQPKRSAGGAFYSCFARSLRSATSAYKGPATGLTVIRLSPPCSATVGWAARRLLPRRKIRAVTGSAAGAGQRFVVSGGGDEQGVGG
jgi:hypothetical protein